MLTLTVALPVIRSMLRFRSIGGTIMTTVDNPKVSQTSGKDEDQKEKGFFNRPGAGGKTMWDWMQLLLIPVILVIVGSYFSNQQTQTSLQVSQQQHLQDQANALDQQRAAILQTYIDNIQDLLLNHNLLGDSPIPKNESDKVTIQEVQELARARTLTALQGLDAERKGRLVHFIYEARLIGFATPTNRLFEFNSHVSIINLFDAELSGVNLVGVDLSGANLSSADLSGANLSDAYFFGVNLSGANLSLADLKGTFLYKADLSLADLRGAHNLTQQQLDQVYSCDRATLPK